MPVTGSLLFHTRSVFKPIVNRVESLELQVEHGKVQHLQSFVDVVQALYAHESASSMKLAVPSSLKHCSNGRSHRRTQAWSWWCVTDQPPVSLFVEGLFASVRRVEAPAGDSPVQGDYRNFDRCG